MTQRLLERMHKVCLALPDASERLSHGEHTWFVGGKCLIAPTRLRAGAETAPTT
jgi:hypothetical protein